MKFTVTIANALYETIQKPYLEPISPAIGAIFAPIYVMAGKVNDALGFGDETACLFMLLVWLGMPLMLLGRYVPSGFMRTFYTMAIGMFFSAIVFQWQILHSIVVALASYIGILILPRKLSSYFSFIMAFGYLAIVHFWRMEVDYLGWSLDFSTLQMLTTLKVIAVPFNINDGYKKKKLEKDGIKGRFNPKKDEKGNPQNKMFADHYDFALDRVPNLLEYFGFIFFFPCVLSGPVYEMKDYLIYVYADHLPSSIVDVLKQVGFGVLNLGLYAVVSPHFPGAEILTPEFVQNCDSYLQLIYSVWGCAIFLRTKYFIGWYFAQAACVIGGFGYTPESEDKWEAIDQADLVGVECSVCPRDQVNNWNKNVARWLKRYCYTRISDLTKRRGNMKNMLYTYTISAFWHGFYPGYYMMWASYAFVQEVHKNIFRFNRRVKFFSEEEYSGKKWTIKIIIWNILGFIVSHGALSYFTASFQLLALDTSIAFFNSVYWIGHIILAVFVIVSYML